VSWIIYIELYPLRRPRVVDSHLIVLEGEGANATLWYEYSHILRGSWLALAVRRSERSRIIKKSVPRINSHKTRQRGQGSEPPRAWKELRDGVSRFFIFVI
jgi:hypothetical protein